MAVLLILLLCVLLLGMKKFRKAMLWVLLCIVLAVVGLYGVSHLVNDHYARSEMKRIVGLPLPEDTEYVDSLYYAGNMAGSSNGMEYFGAMLIQSTLPSEALHEYYEAQGCHVASRADAEVNIMPEPFDSEYGQDIPEYAVYGWADVYTFFSEFDLRGH